MLRNQLKIQLNQHKNQLNQLLGMTIRSIKLNLVRKNLFHQQFLPFSFGSSIFGSWRSFGHFCYNIHHMLCESKKNTDFEIDDRVGKNLVKNFHVRNSGNKQILMNMQLIQLKSGRNIENRAVQKFCFCSVFFVFLSIFDHLCFCLFSEILEKITENVSLQK